MHWIAARLFILLRWLFVAVTGAAASQSVAWTNAYLQRLGGHIDEAKRHLESLRTGDIAKIVTEPGQRDQLLEVFQHRVTDLEAAREAIANASVFAKPFVCFFNLDGHIAWATLTEFVPSLPLDLAGISYGMLGAGVGWMLWGVMRRVLQRRAAETKTA